MRTAFLCGHYSMSCGGVSLFFLNLGHKVQLYHKFKKVLIFHSAKVTLSKQKIVYLAKRMLLCMVSTSKTNR